MQPAAISCNLKCKASTRRLVTMQNAACLYICRQIQELHKSSDEGV